MILASRHGEWFLAAFAPHIYGCNLSTNTPPVHNAKEFHLWGNAIYVQSHAPIDGITFYPELRFMGMVMHPVAWDRESSEPILKCRTGKWVERPSDEEAERVIEKTKELGWEWQVNEGGWGRIHVDDLEKIEGPPPDGAF